MAIREENRASSIYIKVKRGKDGQGKDIIKKAFKLPVSPNIEEGEAMKIFNQVEALTKYPISSCDEDITVELVEELAPLNN